MSATKANKRVITKYGNRRLYDKFTSSYISFSDLQKIIANGFDVLILDSKSKEDVTQYTLTSYLIENTQVLDFFSDELLKLIIKNQCHSNELKHFARGLIDQSLTYWECLATKNKDNLPNN